MKKKRKWFKRIIPALLLVVVLIGSVPNTYAVTFQSSWSFKCTDTSNSEYYDLYGFDKSVPVSGVTFYVPSRPYICIAYFSTTPWERQMRHLNYRGKYGGGSELNKEEVLPIASFDFTYNGTTYYVGYYAEDYSKGGKVYSGTFGAFYTSTKFDLPDIIQGAISDYIIGYDKFMTEYEMTEVDGAESTDESTWPGSKDNPKDDTSIGNLILTTQKGQTVLPDNRDTDASKQYQVFKWKSKTDTGFSLTKNKYAQTYVEAVVESRCVIYKHMNTYYIKNNFTQKKIEENNEIKAKFDNFGERGTISKSIRADSLEYVLSFDKIKDLLPKTAKEWHNDIFVGHNYRVYFRVLCMDSLTVIPDSSDGSWHSGGWSYVDFSSDGVVSGNGNGHFDENGEWTTDDKKDDIINGGNDTYIDEDSAKDDRNNSSDWGRKDNDDSGSGLDTGSIKSFLNQVGNVPKAIAKLFSFLPEWVTAFISFGFIVLVALMIIKAIRG